ncbi:sigma factor-like helix-turn-helix DNA-binding protein [Mucilaginibacter sp. P25]|uniref:sigma factor-like helix-turn-helix DNA-binding protein n=1 Tax=unclassified Mucilaginibacter TaxID=2617802 RepID=UPI003D67370A
MKKIQQLLNQHMQYEQATAASNHDFKEYNQHVIHCLQMLTQQQQLILNLSREEGLTHEQIADKLNLSKNTVKNHIVTALKKMREFIKHGQLSILLTISLFLFFSDLISPLFSFYRHVYELVLTSQVQHVNSLGFSHKILISKIPGQLVYYRRV